MALECWFLPLSEDITFAFKTQRFKTLHVVPMVLVTIYQFNQDLFVLPLSVREGKLFIAQEGQDVLAQLEVQFSALFPLILTCCST
jgi:hypothetical protein